MRSHHVCLAMILLTSANGVVRAEPDIVFADFEGADYGPWKATGTAFGAGPAKGTLKGQMPVSGYKGNGLVNSFLGGDGPTGTLTSPEFKIERPYIAFLIGGGGFPDKTCMNLVVDGKVVHSATGPNVDPGGSEMLELSGWDVTDLAGKTAKIVIVDDASGGWGHINVDHIVFTDAKPPIPARPVAKSRDMELDKKFLLFPVETGLKGRKPRVAVLVDGAVVREFEIELSEKPNWYAHLDVSAWRGKKATVRIDRVAPESKALDLIASGDTIWKEDSVYREPLRPQLHFSPRRGWTNDPNGMVYADGEYHLYFQHNPYGWGWGNMHWGHAVSKDMVHWREEPIALYPKTYGDWVFSGSAVVDKANTSGWKKGDNDLLVLAYTSTGRGECIAYSNDRGRTWTEFEGNPVVKHAGRDPRLLWHEPTKKWVMAIYDESEGKRWIALYTSPDLKAWTYQSRIGDFFECPDLFELPMAGDPNTKKWVLTAADSDYMIGSFDGRVFSPETKKLKGMRGRGFYAAQTFSHDPKGRVVQIGWLHTETRGMPFNQSMSLPLELSLLKTPEGPRLAWSPAREIEELRGKPLRTGPIEVKPGENLLKEMAGELIEVRAEFATSDATVTFNVRGIPVVYDGKKQEIVVSGHRAAAPSLDGKQRLTIFADRTGLEIFAADGLCYVPWPALLKSEERSVSLAVAGAPVRFESLDVYELHSIWKLP